MDRESLQEYVERSERILEADPRMDEQNTKVKLTQPLIELLGWDLYSPEVELEYSMQVGSGQRKVDYALFLEETPVVLVESKGADTTLTDSDRSQLRSYMRLEGVGWGLLTNGRSFVILKRRTNSVRPDEVELGRVDLADLLDCYDLIRTLTKEYIETGESSRVAAAIEQRQHAVQTLREQRETVVDTVTEATLETLPDTVRQQVETEADRYVNRLLETLENGGSSADPSEVDGGSGTSVSAWVPEEGANAITGTISRSELDGPDDTLVAVFPTRDSGIPFLKENNAWGFVRINKDPEYVAMYHVGGRGVIRLVARVKSIVRPEDAPLARPPDSYIGDQAEMDPDKRVVVFEPGSLRELEDPIPFETKYPQGLRYTTLGKLRTAETTDDVL